MADSIIRLHHRKGTPALARIFGVCVCVWFFFFFFFFLVRKVRDIAWKLKRGRGSISTSARQSLGSALALLWLWLGEPQKNTKKTASYASNLVPILESEKTLGTRLAAQVTTQTDRVALARRSSAMRTQCERYANAGTRGVSLGGATLGPVPSLLPLNRSFSVACRLMSGLKNSIFLWWKCVMLVKFSKWARDIVSFRGNMVWNSGRKIETHH